MASGDVHRDFKLTTPLTKGPDVKALQDQLNEIAGEFKRIVKYHLAEDGALGPATLHATLKAAYIMGLTESRLDEVSKKHLIAQPLQRTLRRPGGRSDTQKKRAKQRREDLRKKLDQRPSLKTVRVTRSLGAPHWGGSNDVVGQYVEPFMLKRGLPIGSGKRTPAENKAVGGSPTSDHLTTFTSTMARDFPTFAGEDDARALAASMGFRSWQPNSFTSFGFSAGGHTWQAQILWGAAIDHGDHVDVGIHPA
jgi:hypothetical protein